MWKTLWSWARKKLTLFKYAVKENKVGVFVNEYTWRELKRMNFPAEKNRLWIGKTTERDDRNVPPVSSDKFSLFVNVVR